MAWMVVKAIAGVISDFIGLLTYREMRRKRTTEEPSVVSLSPRFLRETQTDEFIREVSLQSKKVQFVVGFNDTLKLAERMMLSAEKELLLISRGEPIPKRYDRVLELVVRAGIPFKFVVFEIGWNNEYIKHYMDLGLKIKYYPTGEFSLLVKDGEESYLSVRNPRNTEDRITVHFVDEVISKSLAEYFDTIWQKAQPIEFADNERG